MYLMERFLNSLGVSVADHARLAVSGRASVPQSFAWW